MLRLIVVFCPGEDIVFSFFRDITELNTARRELEERLKFEELVSEFSAATHQCEN